MTFLVLVDLVTLTSTSGFAYLWSTGQTTQSIVLTQGNYSVQLEMELVVSVPSNVISVTVNLSLPSAKKTRKITEKWINNHLQLVDL